MSPKKLTNSGNIKKGQKLNPAGRPKGAKGKKFNIKERLMGKWKTHPADELVRIAHVLEASGTAAGYEAAGKIWANLLKYFEPSKKPVESIPEKTTPEDSAEAAEETYKLLQELEQDGLNKTGLDKDEGSKRPGLADGTTAIPLKTRPKKNLPGHKEE